MKQTVVTESQGRYLTQVLSDMAVQSEAREAMLCDLGGNIVAHMSAAAGESNQTAAALAAGSFSATKELASIIGEREFSSIHHRGEHASIYIHSIASFLLLVIFDKNTPVGLVKLLAENTCADLEPFLKAMESQQLGGMTFEMADGGDVFKRVPPANPAS